jgi:hypothetical protein
VKRVASPSSPLRFVRRPPRRIVRGRRPPRRIVRGRRPPRRIVRGRRRRVASFGVAAAASHRSGSPPPRRIVRGRRPLRRHPTPPPRPSARGPVSRRRGGHGRKSREPSVRFVQDSRCTNAMQSVAARSRVDSPGTPSSPAGEHRLRSESPRFGRQTGPKRCRRPVPPRVPE